MARRERISTTIASRSRLELATAAHFEFLPADAAREELNLATALDACVNESEFRDTRWERDSLTQQSKAADLKKRRSALPNAANSVANPKSKI
jgi:hypothetical protein